MELKFERKSCGRCGGSGHYSYCQMYGTKCFQCAGDGKVFTKRGAAAIKWMREQRAVPASKVQVGDRVKALGRIFYVLKIEDSKSCAIHTENGIETRRYYTNLVGSKSVTGVFPDTIVELLPKTNEEQIAQLTAAIAYQNTLGKNGKPLKSKGGVA